MINLFKSNDLESIKLKFILIYILNITDVFFTMFLLGTGSFIEANVIMKPIINNEIIITILKFILPIILLVFIFKRMKMATKGQLKKANFFILFCVIFYGIVNLFHIIFVSTFLLGYF